ncbi:MAG: respiratory nitrate reductase subunit gamma, partial [Acidimicrobiia bacterium]|nr:respiratory nitrate reductase subunit gamma [Acidimicrobiia bacterium]
MTTTETPPDSDEKRDGWKVTPSRVLGVLAGLSVVGTLIFWWLGSLPEESHFEIGRPIFGNIPAVIVALFYMTIATFLGVTLYLFAQRAKSWERGSWETRSGLWKQRMIGLRDALLMRTVLEDRQAGLMHSMIYWGFIVLMIGTAILELDHILPASMKFLHGWFYQGYSAVLDVAAAAFVVGIVWAAVRRYGQKPWRLRGKTRPEDAWILFTLGLIGVTGLLTEAARISYSGQPSFEVWSFVGYPLSYLIPSVTASGWHQAFWIVHAVAFVAFLVILPTTKLRHMVTSPVNLALAPRDRPKGAMREVP